MVGLTVKRITTLASKLSCSSWFQFSLIAMNIRVLCLFIVLYITLKSEQYNL